MGSSEASPPVRLSAEQSAEVVARIRKAVAWGCPRALQGQEEDLTQAAALRVSNRLSGGGEVNATYIKMVVHSVIVDEIRRRRARPVEESAELATLPDASVRSPSKALRDAEVGRGIRRCLEQAPDNRRQVLTLHLVGHSAGEIASLLGLGAKAAENLVYRGLAALRTCLEGLGLKP